MRPIFFFVAEAITVTGLGDPSINDPLISFIINDSIAMIATFISGATLSVVSHNGGYVLAPANADLAIASVYHPSNGMQPASSSIFIISRGSSVGEFQIGANSSRYEGTLTFTDAYVRFTPASSGNAGNQATIALSFFKLR